MAWKDGKVVITKIRFSEVSITKELYDVLIVPRENKPFNHKKFSKEMSRDMEEYDKYIPPDRLEPAPPAYPKRA